MIEVLILGDVSTDAFMEAIWYSCKQGHLKVMDHLMVNLNTRPGQVFSASRESHRALLVICQEEQTNIVRQLLEFGVDQEGARLEEAPLVVCCAQGYLEIAEILVSAGESVNVVQKVQGTTKTPLEVASAAGHLHVVKWLVSQMGGQVLATEKLRTPLEAASAAGHLHVVRWLLRLAPKYDARSLILAAQAVATEAGQPDVWHWLIARRRSVYT